MACRGVHFALTDNDREEVLKLANSHEGVVEFIQEELEERWDREWLCETDKAWDAIHRSLTDGTLSFDDRTPLHCCVLGGQQLYDGDDYIVSFLDASTVHSVAEAIAPITEVEFRRKYEGIEPTDYGVQVSDEDFEYTWENFTELRAFFARAAAANRSVIFTVDQ